MIFTYNQKKNTTRLQLSFKHLFSDYLTTFTIKLMRKPLIYDIKNSLFRLTL